MLAGCWLWPIVKHICILSTASREFDVVRGAPFHVFSLIALDKEKMSPKEDPRRVAAVGARLVELGMAEGRHKW